MASYTIVLAQWSGDIPEVLKFTVDWNVPSPNVNILK